MAQQALATSQKPKLRSISFLIGTATAVIAVLILAIVFLNHYVSRKADEAYHRGAYEQAYRSLEQTWITEHDSLVESSLLASTCSTYSDQSNGQDTFCQILIDSVEYSHGFEMPEFLAHGTAQDYQAATYSLESEIRQFDHHLDTASRRAALTEQWYDNSDALERIEEAVTITRESHALLLQAHREIDAGTASAETEQALSDLEAVFAVMITPHPATDWTADDIDQVITDLTAAIDALEAAL